VVALLTVAYVLSFIDRQILGLLITPIKQSLALTDTEIGLLMGPAFAIFYVTLGWPIGWLADRANRRNIIAAGVALWSLMTAACGLSSSFVQLFFARIGVGVGEATLTPSALSLIADLFPRTQRARATALYMAGVPLGTGIAYVVGGKVTGALRAAGTLDLPLLGAVAGWQAAFLAVGLPGLVVALAVLAIREPARHAAERQDAPTTPLSLIAALGFIARRWRAYAPVALGMCAVTTSTYAGGWNAALFERVWQWRIEQTGLWIGLNYLVFGPLGANAGGAAGDALTRRGAPDGVYRACFIGVGIVVVGATLFPLAPSPVAAVALNAVAVFGTAFASGMGSASIVTLAPGPLRAQAAAIYFAIINLLGLMLGPSLVGWLADHVYTAAGGVGPAMATVSLLIGVPGLLILWAGLRPYAAEVSHGLGKAEK
jgi:MFS family permease